VEKNFGSRLECVLFSHVTDIPLNSLLIIRLLKDTASAAKSIDAVDCDGKVIMNGDYLWFRKRQICVFQCVIPPFAWRILEKTTKIMSLGELFTRPSSEPNIYHRGLLKTVRYGASHKARSLNDRKN
jgi:hypothetical protein